MANVPKQPTSEANVFDDAELVALLARETGVAADDVRAMVAGVRRGEDQAEYFGLTPQIQASLENCGVAYYRGRRYDEALQIFEALVFLTQGKRASAWRGAAACHQAAHAYEDAVQCYAQALVLNNDDSLSAAHCGECLCLLGRRSEGMALLEALLKEAPANESKTPHMLRAKAVLAAGGGPGTPSPLATSGKRQRAEQTQTKQTAQAAKPPRAAKAPVDTHGMSLVEAVLAQDDGLEDDGGLDWLEDDYLEKRGMAGPDYQPPVQAHDPEVRAILADPESRANMEKIAEAVRNKELSIRVIADFSDEQMDAGYAVACQFLELGDVVQAAFVCAQMLYLDEKDTRFYQLSGLCAHRMELYCLADYYYGLVAIWRPGGADPATLIYRGEAKMLSAEVDAGLAMVRQGIAQGSQDPQMAELIRRGEALLKQGEMMGKAPTERAAGGRA